MLREDSPDLPDDEGVGLAEMAAVDQEFRARAIEVRAGVGHDTVGPACEGRIAEVGDDRVVRHPRVDAQRDQRLEFGMLPGQLIDARGQPPAEHGREEGGPVARQQPLVNLLQWVRQPTEPPPNSADDPSIEPTAPVWCRDEDQPPDLGLGLEEHHLAQQVAVLGRADELFERLGAAELPEMRPTVLGHHLGQQSSHAVADEDHVIKGGVRAIGVEPAPRRAQILPQQVGRVEDRSARRITEGPELVALAQ